MDQSCDITTTPMIRYTAPPTKYDAAPYGTVCTVHISDDGTDSRLYIQTAQEPENPQWTAIEELVIQAFKPQFENPCFIQDCLQKIAPK